MTEVELQSIPNRPAQAVYQRKTAAKKTFNAASSSSSPLHFEDQSSPRLLAEEADEEMRDRDISCNTTISSDDEDMVHSKMRKPAVVNAALFLSDEEEELAGSDDDGDDEEESDAAFLKRFREARAAKTSTSALPNSSNPGPASSSSLSDPPTASNPSQLVPLNSSHVSQQEPSDASGSYSKSDTPALSPTLPRLTQQSKDSPTPSPYITEYRKQQDAESKRLAREAKVKALASRKKKQSEEQEILHAIPGDADDDEDVSSASDFEGDSLPSAIKAAKIASAKRIRDDEMRKASEMALKKTHGSKVGVLEMRLDDESDSDLDISSEKPMFEKKKAAKVRLNTL